MFKNKIVQVAVTAFAITFLWLSGVLIQDTAGVYSLGESLQPYVGAPTEAVPLCETEVAAASAQIRSEAAPSDKVNFSAETQSEQIEPIMLNIDSGAYRMRYENNVTNESMEYQIFIPEEVTTQMPLVVYLHGDGDVGKVGSLIHNEMVARAKSVYGWKFPFILLVPCAITYSWIDGTVPETLKGLIDFVTKEYSSDMNQIIITGYSRGAAGVWTMVSKYGNYFSAAVPVSNYPHEELNYDSFKSVPVWAIAGGGDSEWRFRTNMENVANEINNHGGNVMFTIVSGREHGDMERAAYTKEVFAWMLGQ